MKSAHKKLRILFITSDKYPPFRPAAKAIFAGELVRRGHVIDWIIQAEKDCPKGYQVKYGNGIAYVGATNDGESFVSRLHKHFLDILNDLRMFLIIRKGNYDLIQIKDKYFGAIIGILAAHIYGTRCTFWLAYPHAEEAILRSKESQARYPLLKFITGVVYKFVLYKIIMRMTDHIFVQSEQMKMDVSNEGIPLAKLTPVPGSVDLNEIPYSAESRADNLGDSSEYRIVYLGTLMRVRKLDFIIRVISKVLDTHAQAKLYLVGKGEMPEDEEILHSEVKRLGIEDAVIFTGFLPMKQAWNYINSAHVCLSPYYPTPILNSTSPTKLIEYMAMGKPVVGNDHPEQSLVIKESEAGLCTSWDEDEFANAIITILDNPSKARDMGIKGRKYVEEHRTNQALTDVVENQYLKIASF